MRRFMTTSICLVILFAGFGCGSKKGSKGSVSRARQSLDGAARPQLKPDPNQKPTPDGKPAPDAANDTSTAATPAERNCVNTMGEVAVRNGETPLTGLDAVVDGNNAEYVLVNSELFYQKDAPNLNPIQLHFKQNAVVDSSNVASAGSKIDVVCSNIVGRVRSETDAKGNKKVDVYDVAGRSSWVASFSALDGSFSQVRKDEVVIKDTKEKKTVTLVPEVGTASELNKEITDESGFEINTVTAKTKDGKVVVRRSKRKVGVDNSTEIITSAATYEIKKAAQ